MIKPARLENVGPVSLLYSQGYDNAKAKLDGSTGDRPTQVSIITRLSAAKLPWNQKLQDIGVGGLIVAKITGA